MSPPPFPVFGCVFVHLWPCFCDPASREPGCEPCEPVAYVSTANRMGLSDAPECARPRSIRLLLRWCPCVHLTCSILWSSSWCDREAGITYEYVQAGRACIVMCANIWTCLARLEWLSILVCIVVAPFVPVLDCPRTYDHTSNLQQQWQWRDRIPQRHLASALDRQVKECNAELVRERASASHNVWCV